MKNIAIIGYGRIGQAIDYYLRKEGYAVSAYDITPQPGVVQIDEDASVEEFEKILAAHDAVVCATPYYMNLTIADAAKNMGVAYFDLTEDVSIADQIDTWALENGDWIAVPQCGLAPGAVSIIAAQLLEDFEFVMDLNIRVGALPVTANNRLKYHLTWSSEGLVNEYINQCLAVVDGNVVWLNPLEGLETVSIDGTEYEAFNTSGGIGSLIYSLNDGKEFDVQIRNANYKTIRYKGHCELMKFLLDDMGMSTDPGMLVDLLDENVGHTLNDVVVIYVQVRGYEKGNSKTLTQREYCKKIYGDEQCTAIQKTTANGVCAVIDHWAKGKFPDMVGIRAPQQIKSGDLDDNPFWKVYEV